MIGQAGVFSCPKVHRYFFNRGSKSRNKVAVGEPAAGSFSDDTLFSYFTAHLLSPRLRARESESASERGREQKRGAPTRAPRSRSSHQSPRGPACPHAHAHAHAHTLPPTHPPHTRPRVRVFVCAWRACVFVCVWCVWVHAAPARLENYPLPLDARAACACVRVEHGPNNVSRWMTWLPISLKNAAKCDKWYQLQNHPITESLNANGAWEKPFRVIPVHATISVSNE